MFLVRKPATRRDMAGPVAVDGVELGCTLEISNHCSLDAVLAITITLCTSGIAQEVNARTGVTTVGGTDGVGINAQVRAIAILLGGISTGEDVETATEKTNTSFEGAECYYANKPCDGYYVSYPAVDPDDRQP